MKPQQTTEYQDKFNDGFYEYRIINLSERDFERLPADYREYYKPHNKDRTMTENEYLVTFDKQVYHSNPSQGSHTITLGSTSANWQSDNFSQ